MQRNGSWYTGACLALASATVISVSAVAVTSAHAETTYTEQEGHHGVNTFTNYHNASGMGPRIDPAAYVQVSCKVYDPYIASVNPDGYWYRIASSPWNDQYYSPANTFMNGDPWGGPYTHNTDFSVPDCGAVPNPPASSAPPPPPQPHPSVTLSRGPAASAGYWYAVSVDHFAANASLSVSCRDSVDSGGFRAFTIHTDGSGHSSSQSGCYSNDGPDHWVLVNGIESNHVSWSAAATPPPNPGGGGSGGSGGGNGGSTGGNGGPPPPPTTTSTPTASNNRCEWPMGYNPPVSDAVMLQVRYPVDHYYVKNSLVAETLYLHFLDGSGQQVLIDWSYFSSNGYFTSKAKALTVGQTTSIRGQQFTDMFFALGSFNTTRVTDGCYAINDSYDFDPSFRSIMSAYWSIETLPDWAMNFTGSAKNFPVYSVGRL